MPHVLPTLPLFTPSPGITSGLDMLAAAASASAGHTQPAAGTTTEGNLLVPAVLTRQGPFNTAATLLSKVVRRILDLEFVEMSEVCIDDDTSPTQGRPPAPARLPITDISRLLEHFALIADVLCSRFPHKTMELFAYQATIVRAKRNYEGKRWVTYNCQFRREALARKDLNWSITEPRLYNEAFTGRARLIARCTFCLQDNHTGTYHPAPSYVWVVPRPIGLGHNTVSSYGPARTSLQPQHSAGDMSVF